MTLVFIVVNQDDMSVRSFSLLHEARWYAEDLMKKLPVEEQVSASIPILEMCDEDKQLKRVHEVWSPMKPTMGTFVEGRRS